MLKIIIKAETLGEKLLKQLATYLVYADLRFFCLKYILTDFYANNKVNDNFICSKSKQIRTLWFYNQGE